MIIGEEIEGIEGIGIKGKKKKELVLDEVEGKDLIKIDINEIDKKWMWKICEKRWMKEKRKKKV